MRKRWIAFAVIASLISGCSNKGSDSEMTLIERKEAAGLLDSHLVEETNKLGLKLFSQLREKEAGNLSISPYSITTALALAYNGSAGETATELGELLGYAPAKREKMNVDHKALMRLLNKVGSGIELKTANSVWGKEDLPLLKKYLAIGKNYFDAEIRNTDFSGQQSVTDINNWVSKNTESKIEKMLEDPLGENAVAVLVNAVYFKGGWKNEFVESDTRKADFHPTPTTSVQVDMMNQSGRFLYAESEKWQAIRLLYGEGQMNMLVILPRENVSLEEIQTELMEDKVQNTIFDEKSGEIDLPRFKVNYGTDLKEAVMSQGVKLAFDENLGDFSALADIPDPIFIAKIIHKTYVEVNEQGTEAAASTLVAMETGSAQSKDEPFKMTVNRPFVYVIEDSQTGVWLFLGTIENPIYAD